MYRVSGFNWNGQGGTIWAKKRGRTDLFIYLFWSGCLRMYIYIRICLDRIDGWIWRHWYWHLARNQIWTGGTRIFSPLLYQLSYPGSSLWIILVQVLNLCQLKIRKKYFSQFLQWSLLFSIWKSLIWEKMDCNWIISNDLIYVDHISQNELIIWSTD